MNYTTNFELNKPEGSDFYDIEDHNENMDVIDEAMGDFYEELEDHEEILGEHDKALCRTNLLDNWYFPIAVNQRGQTSWAASYEGITVDRWKKTGTSATVTYYDEYSISLSHTSSYGTSYLRQYLDKKTHAALYFRNFTVTVVCIDVEGTTCRLVHNNIGDCSGSLQLHNGINTFVFSGHTHGYNDPYIGVSVSNVSDSVDIVAIKLELGETQTLAREIDGEVVLLDVPKYGEQLLRCKRFYQVIAGGVFPGKVFLYSSGNYQLYVCLPLQVDMDESISSVSVSGITGSSFWDLVDGSASLIDGVYKATDAKLGNQNEPRNGCYYVRCSGDIVSSHNEKIGIARGLTVILSTE